MNINNIRRALDNAGIWYSCLRENDDINVVEVTVLPCLHSEMHKKLFVLTTANIREAEKSMPDWNGFINVLLDSNCTKYLRRLSPMNLIIVGHRDIGRAIDILNAAMR